MKIYYKGFLYLVTNFLIVCSSFIAPVILKFLGVPEKITISISIVTLFLVVIPLGYFMIKKVSKSLFFKDFIDYLEENNFGGI
jgi:hypothetical protein